MMHNIAVRCGNGTRSVGFGVSKVDHGEDHGFGFGEGSNLSTRAGTIRVMGSRVGGTCTPLGTSRANWVFPRGWYLQSAAEKGNENCWHW